MTVRFGIFYFDFSVSDMNVKLFLGKGIRFAESVEWMHDLYVFFNQYRDRP